MVNRYSGLLERKGCVLMQVKCNVANNQLSRNNTYLSDELLRKALREAQENYKDFGGIPVTMHVKDSTTTLLEDYTTIRLQDIAGKVTSVDLDSLVVTAEIDSKGPMGTYVESLVNSGGWVSLKPKGCYKAEDNVITDLTFTSFDITSCNSDQSNLI